MDREHMDAIVERLQELAAADDYNVTPLHLVADYDWDPFSPCQVAAALIRLGAEVDARDAGGQTTLSHLATRFYCRLQGDLWKNVKEEEEVFDLARVLLIAGADPASGKEHGFLTALDAFPEIARTFQEQRDMEANTAPALALTCRQGRL
jgi:ankyrin repeat protein